MVIISEYTCVKLQSCYNINLKCVIYLESYKMYLNIIVATAKLNTHSQGVIDDWYITVWTVSKLHNIPWWQNTSRLRNSTRGTIAYIDEKILSERAQDLNDFLWYVCRKSSFICSYVAIADSESRV